MAAKVEWPGLLDQVQAERHYWEEEQAQATMYGLLLESLIKGYERGERSEEIKDGMVWVARHRMYPMLGERDVPQDRRTAATAGRRARGRS